MKLGRSLVFIGSLLLLATGLMHSVGYFSVVSKFTALNTPPQFLSLIKSLWWPITVMGIVLCPALIWASRLPNARGLLLLCTAIPVAITVILFCYIGVFIGSIGMALASALLVAGGLLLPPARTSNRLRRKSVRGLCQGT